MNSRRQDDHVWAKELLHYCDWDGGCLIDDEELSLRKLGVILRANVLDGLSVVSININSDNCVVKFWICTLQNFIVLMLFII